MRLFTKCFVLLGSALGVLELPSLAATSLPIESASFEHAQLADTTLLPGEKLGRYATYNFGGLWTQIANELVVGFIGPAYQRMRLKILTTSKSATDPTLYQITGKTEVLGVVRSFSGTLRLEHIREARPVNYHDSEQGAAPDVTVEGVAIGSYELAEDQALAKTGTFRGIVATRWYLDHKKRLHYDDINKVSDNYCNNQFVGTWTSYATKKALRCNWGDYRIPNSGDFDIGAGEFSPADKYLAHGWQDMRNGSTTAQRREAQSWWK